MQMRILWIVIITFLFTSFNNNSLNQKRNLADITETTVTPKSNYLDLYNSFGLAEKIQFKAFEQAMQGWEKINAKNKNIITIIDFSLPSTQKRMVVLDLVKKQVLFHTLVSHGRNSGEKYATSFSNQHGSYQSSLGFYLTENTYIGGNGYSLRLKGLEKESTIKQKPELW